MEEEGEAVLAYAGRKFRKFWTGMSRGSSSAPGSGSSSGSSTPGM